jgi:tetratricopeptide (TPR) repeat protein
MKRIERTMSSCRCLFHTALRCVCLTAHTSKLCIDWCRRKWSPGVRRITGIALILAFLIICYGEIKCVQVKAADEVAMTNADSLKRIKQITNQLIIKLGQPIVYTGGILLSEDIDLKKLFQKGRKHLDSSEYDRAIQVFNSALALETLRSSKVSALEIHIGVAYYNIENWEKAEVSYQRALNWAIKGKDECGMVASYANLGLLYDKKGNLDKAIELFEKQSALGIKLAEAHVMAHAYYNLAETYERKNEWDTAIKYYTEALSQIEHTRDAPGIALVNYSLGYLYTHGGGFLPEAVPFYEKSLQIEKELGNKRGMAGTYNGLGYVYTFMGYFDKAIDCYQEELEIMEEMHDHRSAAGTLHNLGFVYEQKGEFEQAMQSYRKSLEIAEKIGDDEQIGSTKYNLAILLKRQDNVSEAKKLLEESLEIQKRTGDTLWIETIREVLKELQEEIVPKEKD